MPDSAGTWVGTNGFRLMPSDPLAEFPAKVIVTNAAGGNLAPLLIGGSTRTMAHRTGCS